MSSPAPVTRAEVCVLACAESWRGDGEILASPMGTVPTLGAWLAKCTFAPELLLTDGEARVLVDPWSAHPVVEGWLPYRAVFEVVASGRRHVMMGASQLGRWGDQNISCIGEWRRPAVQLLGVRGAPGNTVNHRTSYWVPRHSARVFTEPVDMVSGVGARRAAAHPAARRHHQLGRVVTDLAVLDFATPDGAMRLVSVHPGVSVQEVESATGFPLERPDTGVAVTREPDRDELELIRTLLDPAGRRAAEVAG
ncbi:MAG: CoA-transferase subunit beta [Mycobacteriales bacterium]